MLLARKGLCAMGKNRIINNKIIFFIFGFFVSWFLWSSIYYFRSRPIDIVSGLDNSTVEMLSGLAPWLSDSIAGGYGKYIFLSSKSDKKNIMIFSESKTFPFVIVSSREDGMIETIQIVDSEEKILSATDSDFDSSFDSFDVLAKSEKGVYSLIDKNFDGNFDIKISDDGQVFINKDGGWAPLNP